MSGVGWVGGKVELIQLLVVARVQVRPFKIEASIMMTLTTEEQVLYSGSKTGLIFF